MAKAKVKLNTTDERIFTAREKEQARINALLRYIGMPEGPEKTALAKEWNFGFWKTAVPTPVFSKPHRRFRTCHIPTSRAKKEPALASPE